MNTPPRFLPFSNAVEWHKLTAPDVFPAAIPCHVIHIFFVPLGKQGPHSDAKSGKQEANVAVEELHRSTAEEPDDAQDVLLVLLGGQPQKQGMGDVYPRTVPPGQWHFKHILSKDDSSFPGRGHVLPGQLAHQRQVDLVLTQTRTRVPGYVHHGLLAVLIHGPLPVRELLRGRVL